MVQVLTLIAVHTPHWPLYDCAIIHQVIDFRSSNICCVRETVSPLRKNRYPATTASLQVSG